MTIEYVDILRPPRFEPTGEVKPVVQAVRDLDWLGAMNLWIVRPGPMLLYQQRPPGGWEPGKLDGSVGGYYRAGEKGLDALREVEEELGWRFDDNNITLIGRHLSVGIDSLDRERRVVVTVYMTYDNLPISRFTLDRQEVPAIYELSVVDVLHAFDDPEYSFTCKGIDCEGRALTKSVNCQDFSYVFGGYHRRIAQIAAKYAVGERSFPY